MDKNKSEENRIKSEEDKKNTIENIELKNNIMQIPYKLRKFCTIINTIISVVILGLVYCVINNYVEDFYVVPFYLTLWSFGMNAFYILSITIIDLIYLIKNPIYIKHCHKYNYVIRNLSIRIIFPFSFSIVFLYWMLIFLGDEFEYNSRGIWDNCIAFTFHGLIFLFLCFDFFTHPHINIKGKKKDIIIITIMTFIYFGLLVISKYVIGYNPYNFMSMTNETQIIASAILIYIGILDGYAIFILLANRFFIQEEKKDNNEEDKEDDKAKFKNRLNIEQNKTKECLKQKENGQTNINILDQFRNLKCNKIKLKPINLNKNKENEIQINDNQ